MHGTTHTVLIFCRYPLKSPCDTSSRTIILCMNEIVIITNTGI